MTISRSTGIQQNGIFPTDTLHNDSRQSDAENDVIQSNDAENDDNQSNEAENDGTQSNDAWHRDTQHNSTQYTWLNYDTHQEYTISVVLSVEILSAAKPQK